MKTLIAEDDFTSRVILQEMLKSQGPTHVAINGREAVDAFLLALDQGEPYDLVCMDIMMPGMDGMDALKEIRATEKSRKVEIQVRIVMTTAVTDMKTLRTAYENHCDGYLNKPILKAKLFEELKKLELIRG
jgi:two-component system chemotaxis response regulator CheY